MRRKDFNAQAVMETQFFLYFFSFLFSIRLAGLLEVGKARQQQQIFYKKRLKENQLKDVFFYVFFSSFVIDVTETSAFS